MRKIILVVIVMCMFLVGCADVSEICETAMPTESNEIKYTYDISNKTVSEIVDIINMYTETLPEDGVAYESVIKNLKVEPVIEKKFNFYYAVRNNKGIPAAYYLNDIDGDYIIFIKYPNLFIEMDNEHVGLNTNDILEIQMVISSYEKAELLFVSLTNYFSPDFDNKKSDTSGTYWYSYLYSDTGCRYAIDLTYSDGLEGYILNFKIET